jgi:hypothetical protein
MKKNRLIFSLIFGLFHVFIVIFSLYMDNQKDNIGVLLSMQKKIWLIKYGSFLGLILLITDFVWSMRGEKEHVVEKDKLEQELKTLKAKLFDLQEAAKSQQNYPPKG